MKTQRLLLVVSAVSMAAMACNLLNISSAPPTPGPASSAGTDEPSETEKVPESEPASESNPLHVQVILEEIDAASETIPVEGGTLQATGADGTQFTLTLPPNALLSEELITITPVVGVDDLPLSGGLMASLHLAPEGLRLLEPAVLLVEPPEPPVSGQFQLIGFAYHGEGEEFHLYPIKANETDFEVQLMHFSGYGAGLGTQSDVDRQRDDHPPSSPEDQAYQDMDPGAGEQAMYDQLLARWAGVLGSLILAQSDENLLDFALSQFVSWRATVMGVGLEWRFDAQIQQAWDHLASAVTFAAQRAYMSCVQDHEPEQVARILRWIKWVQGRPEVLSGINLNSLLEYVDKCAQFVIEFDSVIDIPDILGLAFHSRIRASNVQVGLPNTTLLLATTDSLRLQGEGNLEYLEFTASEPQAPQSCPITGVGLSGSTLRVAELKLPVNLNIVYGASYYVTPAFAPGIELTLADAPDPLEVSWEWTCPDLIYSYPVTSDIWSYTFTEAHKDEIVGGQRLVIKDWVEAGKNVRYLVYAQKIYDRTMTADVSTYIDDSPVVLTYSFHEKTILRIRHSPKN